MRGNYSDFNIFSCLMQCPFLVMCQVINNFSNTLVSFSTSPTHLYLMCICSKPNDFLAGIEEIPDD